MPVFTSRNEGSARTFPTVGSGRACASAFINPLGTAAVRWVPSGGQGLSGGTSAETHIVIHRGKQFAVRQPCQFNDS